MLRTVTVMASVLLMLMGGGWLLQSAVPPGLKAPLVLSEVDQGIPLTRIVIPAAAPIATAEEAAAVAAWWRRQSPDLIRAAQSVIPMVIEPPFVMEPTELYAYGCADGAQVVLFTNYDGLLGRCEFDATGALRFCESKPSGILPIIIPHDDASRRRLSPEAAQELAVRLLRLRDCRTTTWDKEALVEPPQAQWQRHGDDWLRTTQTSSASGDRMTRNSFWLDANGSVREVRSRGYWRSSIRAKKTPPQQVSLD